MKLLSVVATCVYSSSKNKSDIKTISKNKIKKIENSPEIYFEKQILPLACGAYAIDNLYQTPGLLFDNADSYFQEKVLDYRSQLTDDFAPAHFDTNEDLWKKICADDINNNYDFDFIHWVMKSLVTSTGVNLTEPVDVFKLVNPDKLIDEKTKYKEFANAISQRFGNTDGLLIWNKAKKSNTGHFYAIRKFGSYWYLLDSMKANPIKYNSLRDMFSNQIKPLFQYRSMMHTKIIGVSGVKKFQAEKQNYPTKTEAESENESKSRKTKQDRQYIQMNKASIIEK